MGDISKNFSAAEFACKCGCGFCSPSAKLVATLQAIRDRAEAAMTVASGCRCTEHNKKAGSSLIGLHANLKKGNPGDVTASAHTRGEAADIKITGAHKGALYDLIVGMHKRGELPWLKYAYKISGSVTNVHVGVDDFKKRQTPYGGDA
jgi:uncharacterized protein YcbK (DUF882 family)